MITTFALSWVLSDQELPAACEHRPGMWRTDPAHPRYKLPFMFVAECRECGAVLHAEGTAWGTITKIVSVEGRKK